MDAYAAYKDIERQLADAKELLRESDGACSWRLAVERGRARQRAGLTRPGLRQLC